MFNIIVGIINDTQLCNNSRPWAFPPVGIPASGHSRRESKTHGGPYAWKRAEKIAGPTARESEPTAVNMPMIVP